MVARRGFANAKVFSHHGVTEIDPRYLSFSITTDTGAKRDALRQDPKIYGEFCDALLLGGSTRVCLFGGQVASI
jgi:hypothetical protein